MWLETCIDDVEDKRTLKKDLAEDASARMGRRKGCATVHNQTCLGQDCS